MKARKALSNARYRQACFIVSNSTVYCYFGSVPFLHRLVSAAVIGIVSCAVVLAGLTACKSKEKPDAFRLVIGPRSISIPMENNWQSSQSKMIAEIQPLWTNLASGKSEFFQMVRVIPFDALDTATKQGLESSGFTKGLHGYQSPQWRFFRNRSGISGIEQLNVDGEVIAVASANDLNWQFLEDYLRNRLLTTDRIGLRKDEHHQ